MKNITMKKINILALLAFVFTLGFGAIDDLVINSQNIADASTAGLPTANAITTGSTEGTQMDVITMKIYKFAKVFAGIVLAVSAVMLVYGGFAYVTSQGDPRQAETAKMVLIAAGIGIVITLSAFILLNFFITLGGDGGGA